MTKKIQFHVGKNYVKLRGDWTHDPYKRKKITPQVGLELGTFRFQEQNTITEPRRLITSITLKKLTNLYTYDSVLANFSQVPPSSAKFHLYRTNINYFWQLFYFNDINEPSWATFENIVFGLYFLNPVELLKIPCLGSIDFVSYINYHHRFYCTLAQFLGNFSWCAKYEVLGKILRWFSFFGINIHT